MAGIAVRSSTQALALAAPSLTLSRPTGTVSGDILVLFIANDLLSQGAVTLPAGFTLVREDGTKRIVAWKRAGSSEPATYSVSGSSQNWVGFLIAVSGAVATGDPVNAHSGQSVYAASSASAAAPGATTTYYRTLLLGFFTVLAGSIPITPPSGMTELREQVYGGGPSAEACYQALTTAGATGTKTASLSYSYTGVRSGQLIALTNGNEPPAAPGLVAPAVGSVVDTSVAQRFAWLFSDPDPGDTQSAFTLQIRVVGSGTNTVNATVNSPASNYDLPAGTLGEAEYEWRVQTFDAQGAAGAWSSWIQFSGAVPPDVPSITDPSNEGTISSGEAAVSWSAAEQDAYQLRRVADFSGGPDPGTVYFDTGTVEGATARTRSVTFETNQRYEHIQVRVRNLTLWSAWASIRVLVSYEVPATPTITVQASAQGGYIAVSASHPTPAGEEPTVSSMAIWRSEEGAPGIRIAVGVSPTATFQDYAVASGVDYTYQVQAVGETGAWSWSEWA